MKSRIFERADPHAVSDYVNQHVGVHCIRLPRTGTPQASLSHCKFGKLDLCQISYGGSVHVTSPALKPSITCSCCGVAIACGADGARSTISPR